SPRFAFRALRRGLDLHVDVRVEHLLDVRFPHSPDLLVHYSPAFEHEERGYAADLVPARRLDIGIHVQLADFYLACVLGRDLVDRGPHLTTRAAPLRPEIYENRSLGFQYIQ